MGLTFKWDKKKATSNFRKHGVSCEEAATVFGDRLSLTVPDPDHSRGEERFIVIGLSALGRLLVVAHKEQSDTIRIISAPLATRGETVNHEESQETNSRSRDAGRIRLRQRCPGKIREAVRGREEYRCS